MNFNPPIDINGCNPRMPLIYAWHVDGSLYVGKAKDGKARAFGAYKSNMKRIQKGLPYRQGNGQYRDVHFAIHKAWRSGAPFRLEYLENCEASDLGNREKHYRRQLNPDLNAD